MTLKLDLIKYEVYLVELKDKVVKLINLIEQVVIKDLILYYNIDFLSYLPNILVFNIKFFNFFLRFKIWLANIINSDIMNPIF